SAQGEGIPTVLQAILDLGNAVVGLQTTMNFIQTRAETLAPPFADNVRITPPIRVHGVRCEVANVDNTTHHINIELVDGTGKVRTAAVRTAAAGEVQVHGGSFEIQDYYCRFTVLDGVRGDIRGSADARLDPDPILVGVVLAAE